MQIQQRPQTDRDDGGHSARVFVFESGASMGRYGAHLPPLRRRWKRSDNKKRFKSPSFQVLVVQSRTGSLLQDRYSHLPCLTFCIKGRVCLYLAAYLSSFHEKAIKAL